MKSAQYWRKRFALIGESAHKDAQRTIQEMEGYYLDAQRSVQKEVESWYTRFAANNEIGLTDARKLLNAGQLEEFRWDVKQYIKIGEQAGLDGAWLKKLENASARFHISRLEAIQTGIQQQIELLYGNQTDALDALLRRVAGNGYIQTAYEIQKGIGIGWNITAIDQRRLDILLSKPWTTDGRTFRDRCWMKKQELVGSLQKELTQGLLRGDSPQKITGAIQKQFGVSRYQAGRLVNTETTYFNAVATKECYKDLDVESVEIIETLDSHTCSICGEMDGKVIPISQYEPGVTVPPYHPNCRGTTAPSIDEEYAGERAARNEDGEVYYVPGDMSYQQWKKAFVDEGKKDELTVVKTAGIIKQTVSGIKEGDSNVHLVGRIDIEKYRCITEDITTDEVIITPERIVHIEDHHPGHLKIVEPYLKVALEVPDYILEDKNPNTGLILKEIETEEIKIQVVLRVHTPADEPGFKNSIISAWKIRDREYRRLLRNKKILYKRE